MKNTSTLAVLLLGIGMIVAVVLLLQGGTPVSAPLPQPVPAGDQEIAWLHPATNGAVWERFVAGLHFIEKQRADLGLTVDDAAAFPEQTSATPAVALRVRGATGTLWLRWYKLSGQHGIPQWLDALGRRTP